MGGSATASGRVRTVEVVVNPHSGSTNANTAREAEALLATLDVEGRVTAATGAELEGALKDALGRGPDLLATIAGDGTARAAAELCGPDGPLYAPLPGGTMNVLPKALYGSRAWPQALGEILVDGVVREVSGGEVDGRLFFVAAILGSPALWAEAREAARELKPLEAVRRAQHALGSAFKGRLRFDLESHGEQRAEALTLLCPLISHELEDDARVLEAAAVDPSGAADVFRLAFHALVDDWRADPAVHTWLCRRGRAWARGRIPAIIDGEPVKLGRETTIGFRAKAFRALAPAVRDGAEAKLEAKTAA